MDIGLPGMSGIKGVMEIKKKLPTVTVIMLTVHGDNDNIFDAICAGAAGYLLKTAPLSSITGAIREAREGGSIMSPKIARRVLSMFARQNKPRNQDYGLTGREKEVLELFKTGKTKKHIADILCLSASTIDSHVRKIYEKLEVHSRAALIRKLYGLRD
jgi:DNA-binding NarL/FixJ family response regulator